MNKIIVLGFLFGPVVAGFFIFLLKQIGLLFYKMYKWIVEFINEVNNKPKNNKIEPIV